MSIPSKIWWASNTIILTTMWSSHNRYWNLLKILETSLDCRTSNTTRRRWINKIQLNQDCKKRGILVPQICLLQENLRTKSAHLTKIKSRCLGSWLIQLRLSLSVTSPQKPFPRFVGPRWQAPLSQVKNKWKNTLTLPAKVGTDNQNQIGISASSTK